jgi:solute carrier family 25 uncoupling protein 8/9
MKGASATLLREATYATIRLGTYESFKDLILTLSNGELSQNGLPIKIISASIAAALGSSIATPTDVIKVRLQARHSDGPKYRSTTQTLRMVWHEGGGTFIGGITSIYRGATPTITRGIVISTTQISTYDHAKQMFKTSGLFDEGMKLHVAASSVSGLLCSIVSNPIDVVKVRLMNDRTRQYSGMLHCIVRTFKSEGFLAFYKGFMPCWTRLGSHTVLTYLVYERIRKLAGVRPM